MGNSILIAGIGNIFHGDDAFGVTVVHKLSVFELPQNVRVMEIGIRSIDLGFALLDQPDLIILVDATVRGGAPGTLYTIQIEPEDIPEEPDETSAINGHDLSSVGVLMLAKRLGASLKRVLLVGCEPLLVEQDDSGHIGLSEVVEAALNPAVETILRLAEEFTLSETALSNRGTKICTNSRLH
jgi:hydrogenase maturation protease